MTAALVAALAFGALGLSDLAAMKQLGLLCGAGELLTSVAILALTPEIGAHLERGAPPPLRSATWLGWVTAAVASPRRARITLAAMAIPVVAILFVGWPHASDAIVAIRPQGLTPLVTQEEIYRLFGGRSGQWIVITSDVDAESARDRADAIAESLSPLARDHAIDGYDALTTFAPSERTMKARLAERDALDLPAAAARLDEALRDPGLGFDHDGFAGAVAALAHPATAAPRVDLTGDEIAWLAARHVAKDGDDTLVATFVRTTGDPDGDRRALSAIHAADAGSIVTGSPLDGALRASLARDLPRVGIVALAVAAIALGATLRKGKHVLLALAVVAVEIAGLGIAMRAFGIHWHAYDALVVPVLIGVTLDESMFLLYGATTPEEALRVQGPLARDDDCADDRERLRGAAHLPLSGAVRRRGRRRDRRRVRVAGRVAHRRGGAALGALTEARDHLVCRSNNRQRGRRSASCNVGIFAMSLHPSATSSAGLGRFTHG